MSTPEIRAAPSGPEAVRVRAELSVPASPAVNILLVDDQPRNLLALEALLEGIGQNVVTARSGSEALRRVLERDFAVVLMDVQMPGIDGFETARLIRERDRSRHTPIIFLTAHGRDDAELSRGYSLGAVDFLFKPLVPEILRSKVAVFVRLRHMADELKAQAELLAENQRREHERRLAEERQRWEMERLRAEAAREKQAALELAEQDRRKDEFLAMLGHELRNPLAPIFNALHVMRLRAGDAQTVATMRDVVERQARQLGRLVDDLLDVARISRGKIRLQTERVELGRIIERAVEAARPLVESRRHRLEVSPPAEPLWLEADPTRLEQILTNLLTNAAKYTVEGGLVWLSAVRERGQAVVRVRDTGVGISAEMLPRIFEPFTQADRSLDRSQGGLGVGLTLVKRLIEMHGGTVLARSEGPGKGSEFEVRLPALVDTGAAPEASPPAEAPSPRVRRRILVVDDNRDSAESLAAILRLDGHEVRTAYDGSSAVETALREGCDVVLLDIGLPGLDGYEVARQIRQHGPTKAALLIAMTGYGQEQDRARCKDAGFDAHLVKPVDPDAVREMVAAG